MFSDYEWYRASPAMNLSGGGGRASWHAHARRPPLLIIIISNIHITNVSLVLKIPRQDH